MRIASTGHRSVHNELNKVYPQDRAVHEWYRFVLSFPPHLVRDYVRRLGIGPDHTVLDPFCGTGTTIVEAKKLGLRSIGIEANPLAHFASEVKVDWTPDADGLCSHARDVAQAAYSSLAVDGIEDTPLFEAMQPQPATLRTLPDEAMKLLLSGSISPLPLHKALVLRDTLERFADQRYHRHEMLALAKIAVSSASNLHFGPEVGVGPAKVDAPVVSSWLQMVQSMATDLREVEAGPDAPARVIHADARRILSVLEPASVDLVFTSPPYPNEKDYTRTTRLESVILGFIHDRSDLRALKQTLLRSNTRNVYKADMDDQWIVGHERIEEIAAAIEERRIALGKTSGFERLYARVTKLYFGGMARHLAELRTVLRPGARLAYVVGDQASYLRIMIPTGQLLADIASSLGYVVESIDLFRLRMATATRAQLREEVVVLRWPG